jgi:hypothetical protein
VGGSLVAVLVFVGSDITVEVRTRVFTIGGFVAVFTRGRVGVGRGGRVEVRVGVGGTRVLVGSEVPIRVGIEITVFIQLKAEYGAEVATSPPSSACPATTLETGNMTAPMINIANMMKLKIFFIRLIRIILNSSERIWPAISKKIERANIQSAREDPSLETTWKHFGGLAVIAIKH